MYLLASEMFVAHFAPEVSGVSVPHISPDQIASFVIPLPPIEEQASILFFLDAEVVKLEVLEAQTARAVVLLKERRSALIAAAVTGKIDVRGIA
jgi:type I restriction enzyme S subunit